jgi:peptidoglycan/xylan/chitin deacetylase (PgdA/CDA1 family)
MFPVTVINPDGGVSNTANFEVRPQSVVTNHAITTWPDNKRGAVSLALDDGCTSHISLGVPALNARGLKGTFFVVTDLVGTEGPGWDSWRSAASQGHEIGSHTITHPDLTTLTSAQRQNEIAGSKAIIDAQITSQKTVTFAYPFGTLNSSVAATAQSVYIASRGVECAPNTAPYDFSDVLACSPDDGDDVYAETDAAEQQRGWLVTFIHTLNGGNDGCWGEETIGNWTDYLDYLKTRNLWVGTFGAAVKYIKERTSATLSVVSSTTEQIVLNLTDSLDDATYNQPLTLRSEVPSGWLRASVQQGATTTEFNSVVEGTTRVVYYNALPDRGTITLRDPNSNNPQITSLDPNYASVGGAAFSLTVLGSKFVNGSKVRWNGADRTTTYVSATQLRAAIAAADITVVGTIPVTVQNPNGGISNAMSFEIRGPQPVLVSLTPSWVNAGGPAFTLTVDGSNFVTGSKVRWSGSDRTTTFVSSTELLAAIPASDIAAAGSATVTVSNPAPGGGLSNGLRLDILPGLSSVTVNPSSVVGGTVSTGTVTLTGPAPTGGAVVSLSSSNLSAAGVPGNVTVSSGSTNATFTITTTPVATSTAVNISAYYGGATRSATLTVNRPALSSLSLSPSTVTGGNPSTGTITLSGPAPAGGIVVSLSSSNGAAASVPATVTVSGGNASANFPISTNPVTSSTSVTISAVFGGATSSRTLTVNRTALSSISRNPATVVGGNPSTGTVTLTGPAPAAGVVVSLSSSNTSVARVPASVTVPGGSNSANFTITTSAVTSTRNPTIRATYRSVTRSTTLTVTP